MENKLHEGFSLLSMWIFFCIHLRFIFEPTFPYNRQPNQYFSHCQFYGEKLKNKLVHGLLFSITDFCNTLYYGLPTIILKGLQ